MRKNSLSKAARFWLVIPLAALASCGENADAQVDQDSPLLASELVYLDETENRSLSYEIDPWLASYPRIARIVATLRRDALDKEDCLENSICSVSSEIELHNRGKRLISVIDVSHSFYGGAHPTMQALDVTFDTQTNRPMRFRDAFVSWEAAQKILQKQWCDAVEQHTTCPPIEDQALAISGSSIFVQTSDFAFGSYVEGPGKAYLPITPELIASVKPDYRSSFSISEDSFGY